MKLPLAGLKKPFYWLIITVLCLGIFLLLLRAIRLNTKKNWLVYSLSLGLGLYTHALSLLLMISHGFYLVIREKFKFNKIIRNYLIASLAGILLLSPWIINAIFNPEASDKLTASSEFFPPFYYAFDRTIDNITSIFIDIFYVDKYAPEFNFPAIPLRRYLTPILLAIVTYAYYFLVRRTPLRSWLFVYSLTLVPFGCLVLRDFIAGGQHFIGFRYNFPSYLGMQLAVANLIGMKLFTTPVKSWQQRLGKLLLIFLLSGQIISCAVSSQAKTWWHHGEGNWNNPAIASIINQAEAPLMMSPLEPVHLISLSYSLNPEVKFQFLTNSQISKIPSEFEEIFLYANSKTLWSFSKNASYKIERVYAKSKFWLWQLKI